MAAAMCSTLAYRFRRRNLRATTGLENRKSGFLLQERKRVQRTIAEMCVTPGIVLRGSSRLGSLKFAAIYGGFI